MVPICLNTFKLHEIFVSRKIVKIVATRCHILKLKCAIFDVGWGSIPGPASWSSLRPLAGFTAAYFSGKGAWEEGQGGGEETGGERRESCFLALRGGRLWPYLVLSGH